MTQFTIFQTRKAIIKGKKVVVESLHDLRLGRQTIFYKIDGEILTSELFWGLSPKFK
jgi:hypothetical protein